MTVSGRLVQLLTGSWLNPNKVQSDWEFQFKHRLGRFGYPLHFLFALLACWGMGGPTVMVEVGAIPLLICWLLRLPFVWRMILDVILQPGALVILAWFGWTMLSITWSENTRNGWHEMTYTRWLWICLALWPVIDQRALLIGALCVGLGGAHLIQCIEWIILRQDEALFDHPPAPDPLSRVSGWWYQPAVGGVMCAASMGLHLGPALFGSGWRRTVGVAGATFALLGLLATGSRGPWIAAACTALFALVLLLARPVKRDRIRSVILVLCAGAVLAAGALLTPLGSGVRDRVRAARVEAVRVFSANDVDSDLGGRVLAARVAWSTLLEHPLRGAGAGSFRDRVESRIESERIAIEPWRAEKLKTAHNIYLHIGATTGLIGLALFLLLAACLVLAQARESVERGLGRYGASPFFATIALLLCGAFDSLHLNHHSAALLTLLVALSAPVRPRER